MLPDRRATVAPTIPTTEPTRLTAGDSVWWNRTLGDYPPSDGWTLKYTLYGPASAPLEVTATVVDGVYQVRITPADTTDLPAGTYTLVGRVSDGTDAWQVYRGRVHVLTDPADVTTDTDHVDAMVTALRAAELTLATQPRASVTVNGRSVEYRSLDDVRKALAYYEGKQAALRRGSLTGPSIAVRFQAPQ